MREIFEKYKNRRVDLDNKQIVNILLLSVVTIMPYIVTNFGYPRYVIGKVYYLYIVAIAIIVMIKREIIISFKLEEKIISIFIINIFIATIFSDYKNVAIWGNSYRKEGLIMFIIYILLFITAAYIMNINKKIIHIVLFLPNIMAVYSIFEFYGFNYIKELLNIGIQEVASMGFVGNRNFYSTYLIIFLIANFSLYILNGKRINLINSTIQFTALICALTRSCWVAFFIVSLIGILFIYKDTVLIKRSIICLVIFSSIFFALNITSNKILTGRVESLIESTTNVTESSGSGRILIWKIVGEVINENYILGEGPDTLKYSIDKYYPKGMEIYESKTGCVIDKAHNEYLEYWVSCGLVTLLSYVSLLIVIGSNIVRRINKKKYKVLFLIFIAYIVQAFFNISVISVAPIWWIFLGYCVQSYRNDEIKENEINIVT